MSQRDVLGEIKVLIQSTQPVIGIETTEEERVRDLVYRASRELSIPFFDWSITRGLRSPDVPMLANESDSMTCLQYIKDYEGDGIFLLKDFSQTLDKPNLVRQFREAAQRIAKQGNSIVLVAPSIELPVEIRHKVYFLDWPLPTREELKSLIQSTAENLQRKGQKVRYELQPADLNSLLGCLTGLTWKQAGEALTYAMVEDGSLNKADVSRILARKAKALRDGAILDYFPPDSLAREMGGFDKLKVYCERAKRGFGENAKSIGLPPPKGILLVGVPGCGKSMAAKSIAASWGFPLLRLDAGRLFDKFIGESEKNFRRAIRAVEAMSPAVFWIDEIEKAMAVNSEGGSDGGLSKRLFGAFLTWLQEKKSDVFVIATANDLSALPPELLRKGRFDEVFFVDLPTEPQRVEILKLHLSRRNHNPAQIDVAQVAKRTAEFSGAELEQLVVSATLASLERAMPLTADLLIAEVDATIPLAHSRPEEISRLRETGRRQFVSVS